MSKNAKRLLPFAVLIILIVIVYVSNLHELFSLEWLQREHARIKFLVDQHPVISPLIYIGFYVISVCLVIPDSTILTLLGGFVFPLPLAIAYAVISETLGSLIFYLVFASVFKLPGLKLKRPLVEKIDMQLKKSPAVYLLFLRISHVIPFWSTNVIAAYFRIPAWTFTWTTFFGVIPLTYILAEAGYSLSEKFQVKHHVQIEDVFTLQVKLALLILGILMMTPLFYRKWLHRRKK